MGMATQDEELRSRFKEEPAVLRVANFLNCSLEELRTFARITGHENLHDMSVSDLCTTSREISEYTNILHCWYVLLYLNFIKIEKGTVFQATKTVPLNYFIYMESESKVNICAARVRRAEPGLAQQTSY